MSEDYSQWATPCLIRELDRKMKDERQRGADARYYIFSMIRANKPRDMDGMAHRYTLGYLVKHLLSNWKQSYNPIPEEFDALRSALQLKVEQWESVHGKIPF